MLLEFSITNHKSYASEQTLSLVATKLSDTAGGRVVSVPGPRPINVLTSAAILGKNGSGKSNLVNALTFVSHFVSRSAADSGADEATHYQPFAFSKGLTNEETRYCIVFSMHENMYQFEFAIDADRIVREILEVADRTARFRLLYERNWDSDTLTHKYRFGAALTGDRNTWKDATRPNALFLSTAIQLNSEVLKPAYDWLTKYVKRLNTLGPLRIAGTSSRHCRSDDKRNRIKEFLQKLDIRVSDITVVEEDVDESRFEGIFSADFLAKVRTDGMVNKSYKVKFQNLDEDGDLVELDYHEQSTGTQTLFELAGPLFEALENGYCVVVDEVNTNLHSLALKAIVEMFSDEALNVKRAQLLFTTHDASIVSSEVFRRDQIWLVDTDHIGRSSLTPLSSFLPRKGEALQRGYLMGRYGGVPVIEKIEQAILPELIG